MYSRASIASLPSPAPSLRNTGTTGLAGFGPFMAEDNMIGLSLWHQAGLKHAMTGDVALDYLGALSVRDYMMRRARWIRVRKMMTLPATLLEPLTESIVASLYGAWAANHLLGVPRVWFWLVSMGLWLATDLSVRAALATNVDMGPSGGVGRFVAAWMAREVLALPIWLYAMLGSTVVWRGKAYRVLASGESMSGGVADGRRGEAARLDVDVTRPRDGDILTTLTCSRIDRSRVDTPQGCELQVALATPSHCGRHHATAIIATQP